jgi:predicted peptidase
MTYPYVELLPTVHETDPAALHPLILYLHGAGERGSNFNGVWRHGPHKFRASNPAFPFIIIAPQCPLRSYWEPERVLTALDDAEARFAVDACRIYLTGLSMGGFGVFETAMYAPGRFAALAPICGGGDVRRAALIAHIPTWVFHGALDDIVPIEHSERMVAALRTAGGNPRYTVYPNAQHDSWTETYNNPEFYSWLLEHQLPQGSG